MRSGFPCEECQGATRVTDSRDERTARPGDYLLRKGSDVYGWYSSEFRVRRRRCVDCGHCAETIEVYLEDLDKSFEDIRGRKERSISTAQLLTILETHKNKPPETALSELLSALLFRASPAR
jgi:hypothetical protein